MEDTTINFKTLRGLPVTVTAGQHSVQVRITTEDGNVHNFQLLKIDHAYGREALIVDRDTRILVTAADAQRVAAILPAAMKSQANRTAMFVVGGIVAVIVLIGLVTALVPKALPTVAAANADITSVERVDGTLVVHIYEKDLLSAADLIDYVGVATDDIGRAIQKGAKDADGVDNVNIWVDSDTRDRLGNLSRDHIMTLTYSGDDFRHANWSDLTIAETVNLAQSSELSPAARQATMSWCVKKGAPARSFCMQALK